MQNSTPPVFHAIKAAGTVERFQPVVSGALLGAASWRPPRRISTDYALYFHHRQRAAGLPFILTLFFFICERFQPVSKKEMLRTFVKSWPL